MRIVNVNYIWIGPPPKGEKKREVTGHDVAGPLMMADCLTENTHLTFWCLGEHKAHYEEVFKEKIATKKIEVKFIETFIQNLLNFHQSGSLYPKNHSIYLQDFSSLLKNILQRGTIRDFVTIKVAFSFLLLTFEEGYVLDTNIFPTDTLQTVSFPHYDHFHMPLIPQDDEGPEMDMWMMYCPSDTNDTNKKWNENQWRAFTDFIDCVKTFESHLTNDFKSYEEYSDEIGNFIVKALKRNHKPLENWLVINDHNFRMIMKDLNLTKFYYNTHKFRLVIHPIFNSVEVGDLKKIEILLQDKNVINKSQNFRGFKRITPLHYAIIEKKLDVIKLLLANGANKDLIIETQGKKNYTCEELAREYFPESLELFHTPSPKLADNDAGLFKVAEATTDSPNAEPNAEKEKILESVRSSTK